MIPLRVLAYINMSDLFDYLYTFISNKENKKYYCLDDALRFQRLGKLMEENLKETL